MWRLLLMVCLQLHANEVTSQAGDTREAMCKAGVAKPLTKYSIKNRVKYMCSTQECGESPRFRENCACDSLCRLHNDCCDNFNDTCRKEAATDLPEQVVNKEISCFPSVGINKGDAPMILGVSTCPTNYNDSKIQDLCEIVPEKLRDVYDIPRFVPVVDKFNILYRNTFCALCNDVLDWDSWKVYVNTDGYPNWTVEEIVSKAPHNVGIWEADGYETRFCVPPIKCKSDCLKLQDSCNNSRQVVVASKKEIPGSKTQYLLARNTACAVCNGTEWINVVDEVYKYKVRQHDFGKFAFSVLLRVNDNYFTVKSTSKQTSSGVFCTKEGCEDTGCNGDFTPKDGTCTEFSRRVLFLRLSSSLNYEHIINHSFKAVRSAYDYHGNLSYFFYQSPPDNRVDAGEQALFQHPRDVGGIVAAPASLQCPLSKSESSVLAMDHMFVAFNIVQNGSEYDSWLQMLDHLKRNLGVRNLRLYDGGSRNFKSCNITGGKALLDQYKYVPVGEPSWFENKLRQIEGYITIALLSISALFLLSRLICQAILPELRKPMGWNQFLLCLLLFIFIVLFLVAAAIANVEKRTIEASILGSLTHFFRLTVFCCSNAIAFSMVSVFVNQLRRVDTTGSAQYIQIALHSILPAVVIMAVAAALELSPNVPDEFRPEYGYGPWINVSKLWPQVLLFYIPVALILVANIVMIVVMIVHIRRARIRKGAVVQSDQSNWQQVRLYLILFVLFGFEWVLAVVSIVISNAVVYLLFTIVLALEGVYLTVATLVNTTLSSRVKSRLTSYGTKSSQVQRSSTLRTNLTRSESNKSNRRSGRLSTSTDNTATPLPEKQLMLNANPHSDATEINDRPLSTGSDAPLMPKDDKNTSVVTLRNEAAEPLLVKQSPKVTSV